MTYYDPYNELVAKLSKSWDDQYRLQCEIRCSWANRFPVNMGFTLLVSLTWVAFFILERYYGFVAIPPFAATHHSGIHSNAIFFLGIPSLINLAIYSLILRPDGVWRLLTEVSTFIIATTWSFLATFLLLSLPLSAAAFIVSLVAIMAWSAFLKSSTYKAG